MISGNQLSRPFISFLFVSKMQISWEGNYTKKTCDPSKSDCIGEAQMPKNRLSMYFHSI